jgi:hypothetical protein
MPWLVANGLLPGRGAPGRPAPERAPPGRPAPPPRESRDGAAAGLGAAGRGPGVGPAGFRAEAAAGASAVGAAGSWGAAEAAGAAAGASAGASTSGAGSEAGAGWAAGAGSAGSGAFRAPGLGADLVVLAGAAARAAAGASAVFGGNFSRMARSTGASSVDDAELTYSPASFSAPRRSLLVIPSSLASAETRIFATSLLSRPPCETGRTVVSTEYSSLGTHRVPIGF